jgi:hypothetical protein
LLAEDIVLLDGRAIDADVTLGRGAKSVTARLVGVPSPKGGYCQSGRPQSTTLRPPTDPGVPN